MARNGAGTQTQRYYAKMPVLMSMGIGFELIMIIFLKKENMQAIVMFETVDSLLIFCGSIFSSGSFFFLL